MPFLVATRLRFHCPCPQGHLLSIDTGWQADGPDFETVTIAPSVRVVGDARCGAHFNITGGAVVLHGDSWWE